MWIPIAILGGMGIIFGAFLTFFSIKFKVEEDPLTAQLYELMPKANCGACGMAGCGLFAELLREGKVSPEKCAMLPEENMEKICGILGIEKKNRERKVARVMCGGGANAKRKFEYNTLKTCNALNALYNTNLECAYGCLGLGDCSRVCPVDAITMGKNGLPEIDEETCIGCGKCVAECPKNIISLAPADKKVYIACSSSDRGPVVVRACKTGCIACGKCVKVCPKEAITLENNLAVIDYSKCDNCGACIKACPRKIIFSAEVKIPQPA